MREFPNLMTVYDRAFYGDDQSGYLREFEWEADVEIIQGMVGRIRCPGCDAEGPVPEDQRDNTDLECVECKDTGVVMVSV